jgi:hypothetical protein
MLAEEDLSDVKACEGANCTLMFADHTRSRSRRWCSMGLCGNRAKQIAHRHRLKGVALSGWGRHGADSGHTSKILKDFLTRGRAHLA